jgi:AAA family ATP:ADP antiporter
MRSRYLLGICGFMLCYTLLSTLLYFQQADIVPKHFKDTSQRTQLLASVDGVVNTLALLIQVGAFGPLIQRLGTRALLVAMPLVSLVGYLALALSPALSVLVAFGVVRRAGEYAISKPARETLFNALPPDQKYRAKNVIDTLIHRTGSTASSWLVNGLRGLGVATHQIMWLAVPLALVWVWVASWLGKRAQRQGDGSQATQLSLLKRSDSSSYQSSSPSTDKDTTRKA